MLSISYRTVDFGWFVAFVLKERIFVHDFFLLPCSTRSLKSILLFHWRATWNSVLHWCELLKPPPLTKRFKGLDQLNCNSVIIYTLMLCYSCSMQWWWIITYNILHLENRSLNILLQRILCVLQRKVMQVWSVNDDNYFFGWTISLRATCSLVRTLISLLLSSFSL